MTDRPIRRRCVLLTALPLLAFLSGGCATAYQPPQGVVWAYTGTSESVSSLRMVAYTATKDSCDIQLAKDRYDVPKRLPWAQMTLSGCQQATVSTGADYWVFTIATYYGMGASTREYCEMGRGGMKGYAPSVCAPVSVHFLRQQ